MKKAVIIGAGPAGVTAAYELLKKSDEYEVLVLEESQEIGGIVSGQEWSSRKRSLAFHLFYHAYKYFPQSPMNVHSAPKTHTDSVFS